MEEKDRSEIDAIDFRGVWQARYLDGWNQASRLIEEGTVTVAGARQMLKSDAWGAFHLGYRSAIRSAFGE